MKKICLLVASMLCFVSVASAQGFGVGDQKITANVGFGGGYGVPIGVSYEKGLWELGEKTSIGLGGYLGYAAYSESFGYGKYKYSDIFLAAAGNWHYALNEKFDLYAGLRLGYDISSGKVEYDNPDYEGYGTAVAASGVVYTVQIGANYYLNETWAINAELGFGLALLSVGATYSF